MSRTSAQSEIIEYEDGKERVKRYRKRTLSGEKILTGKYAQEEVKKLAERRSSKDKDRDRDRDRYGSSDNTRHRSSTERGHIERRTRCSLPHGKDTQTQTQTQKDDARPSASAKESDKANENDATESVAKSLNVSPKVSGFTARKKDPEEEKESLNYRVREHRRRFSNPGDSYRDSGSQSQHREGQGHRTRHSRDERERDHHRRRHHHARREYYHTTYKKLLFPWPFGQPSKSKSKTNAETCALDVNPGAGLGTRTGSGKAVGTTGSKTVVETGTETKTGLSLLDRTTSVSRQFQPPYLRTMAEAQGQGTQGEDDDELDAIERRQREGSQGSGIRNDSVTDFAFVKGDDCPFCGGKFKQKFTWAGIAAAVLLFPCGIYCCFKCRVQVCTYCGVSPI